MWSPPLPAAPCRAQARRFLETMYLPEGGAAAAEIIKRGASKKLVKQLSVKA
jgi:hypothetical protein